MCRALAVNYKKFCSGAPDLLLIRVSRSRTDSKGSKECLDLEKILGVNWSVLGDAGEGDKADVAVNDEDTNLGREVDMDRDKERSIERDKEGDKERDREKEGDMDVDDIDGEERLPTSTSTSITPSADSSSNTHRTSFPQTAKKWGRYRRWRRASNDGDDDLNNLGQTKEEIDMMTQKGPVRKSKASIFDRTKNKQEDESPCLTLEAKGEGEGEGGGEEGRVGVDGREEQGGEEGEGDGFEEQLYDLDHTPEDSADRVVERRHANSNNAGSSNCDIPQSHDKIEEESSDPKRENPPLNEDHWNKVPSRFLCTQPDLVLPSNDAQDSSISDDACSSSSSSGRTGERSEEGYTGSNRYHGAWRYDCMMVEVKGPTDTLAAHQLMWLRVIACSGVTALVGHVKETEMVREAEVST